MSVFQVRFWGTRGSIPAPGPKTTRYGGNTACVELRRGEDVFILDAGTGIRELGNELMRRRNGKPMEADIFVTHTHWDHIQGFPFFIPAYVPGNRFRIHGCHGVGRSFEKIFRGLMDPSYFPVDLGDMAAALEFVEIKGEPFERRGVRILTTFTNHPGVDVTYRFEAQGRCVAYLTDHETYQAQNKPTEFAAKQDKIIEDFCRGADLLVCDAQYTDEEYRTKKGWGHSRYQDVVELALNSQAKRLALFHHDHTHDDDQMDAIEKDAQAIARRSGAALEVFAAREGMALEL